MTDKLAGLSLGVDVSQVDRAVKSLENFSKANNKAAGSLSDFVDNEQVARAKAKELAAELARQRAEFQKLEGVIDPTASKMARLKTASEQLDAAWQKGVVPDKKFFELGEMLEAQNNALIKSRSILTAEGRAAAENAKQKARAKADADSFIRSLERQAQAATMTKQEMLELRAAELGVSDKAAPLISKLNQQTEAFKLSGISAGEYRNAMKMLPAQITDVVTSMATGMPIWMVAIQQGGQISDSFGGIGNAMQLAKDGVIDYISSITELKSAFADVRTLGQDAITRFGRAATIFGGGIFTAVAAIGYAAYSSYSELSELQSAIVLSGGYAVQSAAEMDTLTDAITENSKASGGAVKDIAASMAKSGKYTSDQIKIITASTADWATVTSTSADKILAEFDKIAKDPVSGLIELNKTYNFLEKGQLTYINKLKKTEGQTAAVTAATKIFADVMDDRIAKLAESANPLEKMWWNIKKWSSDAWGSVSDRTLGALNLITDVVAGTVEQVKVILNYGDQYIGEFVISATKAMQGIPGMGTFGQSVIDEQQKIVDAAKKQNEELLKSIAERDARIRKGEAGYLEAGKNDNVGDGYSSKTKEAVDKEAEDLKKLNKEKKYSVDQGVKITEQYEMDIVALQSQLKSLQEHKTINDSISQQRKTQWNEQARILILEGIAADQKGRALTQEEKSILLNKSKILDLAEQKAALGDQIVAQERLNKLQDDSEKFVNKTLAATRSLNDTKAMGDRDAKRYAEREAMKANWTSNGGKDTDPAFKRMIDEQDKYYAAEDAKRADWLAGAENAFENYGEAATDMYANVGSIATNALTGLSDMMTEFLTTGQANFADFAKSIISQIIKMITQMVIFNSISGMMGGSAGGKGFSFANSGWFATGGYTGDGGKYEPAGTVHKGEFVMTKEATKRIGVDNLYRMMRGYANGGVVGGASSGVGGSAIMSGGVTIGSIPVSINNGSDPKGMEQGVKMIFKQMIQESCSQGGEVYNYINGKAGA